jgi:hypothetical protein
MFDGKKTEQVDIRFLTQLKKTATKTLLSDCYSILTKLLQGMLRKTWNVSTELYVVSDKMHP